MARSLAVYVCLSGLCCVASAQTTTGDAPQQTPAAAPAAPAPPAKNPWALGPVVFSATIDGYYEKNFNDPGNGLNATRNFDTRSGQPTLSMAKFSLDMAPAPVGFHLEAGGGKTFDIIESAGPHGGQDGWKQILQAYVAFKPKSWKGVEVDLGKFYTNAGAEVTDTLGNYNYSRSLLYAFAPYYHTGMRMTFPITKTLSGGFQLVEGWNGFDGKNHGVTAGFTSAYTPNAKISWANSYYVGPEDYYGLKSQRNFFDTALTVNPNGKTSFYFNFDYGHDTLSLSKVSSSYYGPAFAARYQLTKKFAVAGRAEIYEDADGFWTGDKRHIDEFTVTGEYKHNNYFLTRVEYRRDSSDKPFFANGPLSDPVKDQGTFLVGVVLFFGPPR